MFDIAPTCHNIMISNYGKHKFTQYIRGICFWEKKIIYLRGHKNKPWFKATEKMLRSNGIAKDIRVIWGEEAAWELSEELRGL